MLDIGEMAELCGVSTRALRLYHEKGILEPAQIDASTGYRRYALWQIPLVDQITLLQTVGFSLDEIAHVVREGDREMLRDRLADKMDELARKRHQIDMAERLSRQLFSSLDEERQPLVYGHIQLERLPEQPILIFPVRPREEYEGTEEGYYEEAYSEVRGKLKQAGVSGAAVLDMGDIIPFDQLSEGALAITSVYLPAGDYRVEGARRGVMPAGWYLTLCEEHVVHANEDDVSSCMPALVLRMLEWAEDHGLEACGDVYDMPLRGTSLFGYHGRDYSIKVLIPVRRKMH